MNTKLVAENIMEVIDKYNFITEYPFCVDTLKGEIEDQINKEYLASQRRATSPLDFLIQNTTGENRRY